MNFGIKKQLLLSVFILISFIILALTIINYQQYNNTQITKLIEHAETIISPFHKILKEELPTNSDQLDIYLQVALLAKGNSQLRDLLNSYSHLEGVGFFNSNSKKLFLYGNIYKLDLNKKTNHIQGKQIHVIVPLKIKNKTLSNTLLAFSSKEFELEKNEIITQGIFSFFIFIIIGLLGAWFVGKSISSPIELLARNIEISGLDNIPLLERKDEIGEFSRKIHTLSRKLKQREEKLLEQKKEFESIFRYSKDAIAILDLNTKFLDFNDSYLNMTGYLKDDFLKKHFIDLIAEEDKEKTFNLIQTVLTKGFVENIEKICITKSGDQIYISSTISLLPDRRRILLVTKDVTSLKLIEKQSKLAAMGEMIGNIAHQWRQPLNVITISASGMKVKSEFDSVSNKEIKEFSDEIITQAEFLSQTIDDFKNFIKEDHDLGLVNIKDVLKKTLTIANASLLDNDIKLILLSNIDYKIKSNTNELIQSFLNIINNSKDILIAETKKGNRYIFIETNKKDSALEVKIYDNGGGIPNDIINRVFEPYFTTKHQSFGTGIGLSMTEQILRKQHNVIIDVQNKSFEYNNKSYKGACFSILFK